LRKQRKLPTLIADKRHPVHILSAAQKGLGVGERRYIELVSVTVS
jgi:hypothetical protein